MKQYFVSENMKTRHTFLNKLIVLAPMFTIVLSLLLTYNYYKVDCFNWWYITMLPGSLAIGCVLLGRMDGKMKNRAILNLPLDLKKIWIAKVMVAVKNLAISCAIIFLFTNVVSFVIPIKSIIDISFLSGLSATIVLIVTFMWQIPLMLTIGNKIGMSLTIIAAIICNSIFGVLSIKDFWFAIPFSYPARLMCPILKILPNGLQAIPESATFRPEVLSYSSIPYGIVISLILFVVLTYITAKMFEKKEAV